MPAKIRFSLLSLALLVSGQVFTLPAQATTTLSQMAPIAQPQIASGSALIVDLTNGKVLFSSHPDRVRPIASITKLMTAMVVLDAHQPMNEMVKVDISQTPEMRGVFSRVKLNSEISRRSMLMLALMSSENRAAASLAHAYPGGYDAFIRAMNAKARALGMMHTHYVEPTGLSIKNVSSAQDLVKLLKATREYPLLGELSTTKEETAVFAHPSYALPFRNTNHLVYKNGWHIQLTKTGYTDQAGHCLVMRTMIKNRPVALVVLDAFGKYTHFADANRLRDWLETGKAAPVPAAALAYKKQKADEVASNAASGAAVE
ncbi:D-alanyl-D-alanine endopeptidase (penicillin-binding protein 7) [Pantoea sp. PNA 14-12]|uniref:D-alanyl-D-alanine endopeptidase n=1 Tax=Pantoea stewartii TaxID=66269 RepID=A0AB34VGJ6_9GAMM|nr:MULTISPECIES: D-alanyl-D-alanine endopeptidase [Pantoea]KGD85238.1 D-alanyl-D-alanine endopeptidase [Pantoea stewartii subsp. indologenes]KHE00343.1 D-alanyl-D-alanine endopeptidase [Pantoea stewartii]KHN62320.1 D-alanyl-D-alanine endopeptidase [Pantoea stewartii]KTS29991.1 D-alanyl-D-alanine endopeptidase [Pantoea stewartii]KTS72873.1 D-alanyl-D-alanine endopeptidase [Pantoea stewartii]